MSYYLIVHRGHLYLPGSLLHTPHIVGSRAGWAAGAVLVAVFASGVLVFAVESAVVPDGDFTSSAGFPSSPAADPASTAGAGSISFLAP